MLPSVLALLLTIAPPPADDYAGAKQQVDDASLAASNKADAEVVAALADALARMDAWSRELADDEAGRNALVMARLNLARGYLKLGDAAAAERELDRLLRESLGEPVPANRFGPELNKLFKQRQAKLDADGKATLALVCVAACEIVLDHHRIEPGSLELYLGSHALTIASVDGAIEPLVQRVELTAPGVTTTVEIGPPPAPEPEPQPEPEPEPEPVVAPPPVIEPPPVERDVAPPPPKRMFPIGVEVDGMVLGAGLAIAGGVMLAYDGRCTDGNPATPTCPKIFESTAGGAISIALGGALLLTSTVLLAIDEGRQHHHRRKYASARFERGLLRF
jgi:hypothetical protein